MGQVESLSIFRRILHTLVLFIGLGFLIGVLSGAASAFFLSTLERCTQFRYSHGWLIFLLPVAGLATVFIYREFGDHASRGNNLLIDEIHQPDVNIPLKMAPLVLFATLATHLFGGSAGREGTSVQVGGTIADSLYAKSKRLLHLNESVRPWMLMAGISGGFGSVFGTPWAGAIFGIEVLSIGKLRWQGLIPCLVASMIGDIVCRGLGVKHHPFSTPAVGPISVNLIIWLALASLGFALTSTLFIELTHLIEKSKFPKAIAQLQYGYLLKPVLGGVAVILLTMIVGNQGYSGLGLRLIDRSLSTSQLTGVVFLLKILFTAITLGCGFKGGEVTSLFCIGATVGNFLGGVTHNSPALFAAIGFVAVFASAANVPIACTVIGVEIFGVSLLPYFIIANFIAFFVSGHRSIYSSQRMEATKPGVFLIQKVRAIKRAP